MNRFAVQPTFFNFILQQHTLVTEIRELIFPEDRTRYDELVYRRSSSGKLSSRMDYYDTHRVSFSNNSLPSFLIRVTFHSFNLILYVDEDSLRMSREVMSRLGRCHHFDETLAAVSCRAVEENSCIEEGRKIRLFEFHVSCFSLFFVF